MSSGAERLRRYVLAAIGPVGVAGTQFVLSLQLLHVLPTDEFGRFSFLLIASQLTLGLSNALFCAPLAVVMADRAHSEAAGALDPVFGANTAFIAVSSLVFLCLGPLLGLSAIETGLFAAYAAAALWRWFGRAHAYARGDTRAPILSDIAYSCSVALCVMMTAMASAASEPLAYAGLLISALIGIAPFGLSYVRRSFRGLNKTNLKGYRPIWRDHARWALLGVLTTEVTANAHAYVVTLVSGAAAFAVIAASGILIRPMTVLMNALTEFERPQLARQLREGDRKSALRSLTTFRSLLAFACIASAGGAALLLTKTPSLVFPARYDLVEVSIAATVWMAIVTIRAGRTAESAALQAAGMFQRLAEASFLSAIVSAILVCLLLFTWGPLWSLAGILTGELIFACWIWYEYFRWRKDPRANS